MLWELVTLIFASSSPEFENLVQADIWTKPMKFEKTLVSLPSWPPDSGLLENPNSDKCLQEIINSSSSLGDVSVPCVVSTDCWDTFFRNGAGNGYFLTHKYWTDSLNQEKLLAHDFRFAGYFYCKSQRRVTVGSAKQSSRGRHAQFAPLYCLK